MKDRVEQFQNLSSNDLIISIDNHKDLIRLAKFLSSPSEVRHRPHLLLVDDNLVPLRWHFILPLQKCLNLLASSICRSIIDEDYMEIRVILHDDRLDIFEMPSILNIVVAGYYDAEGKLIVLANLILFLVILSFFLGEVSCVGEVFIFLLEPSQRCVGLCSGYARNRTYLFRAPCGLSQRMYIGCGRLQLFKTLRSLLD